MKNLKKFVFVFVYLTTLKNGYGNTGKLSKLNKTAKEMGIKSKTIDTYESVVLVDGQSYGVHTKDSQGPSELVYNSNTLNKLYICVNCEISKWINKQLFKLIELVPIFYQSIVLQDHNNIFMKSVQVSNTTLDDTVKHVKRFVNLLLTFINIYLSEYDISNDTQILITLLSLSFDIDCIKNEYEQNISNEYSDVVIIRVLLGALNSIRQFMLHNCDQYFYFNKNQLYLYSTHDYGTKEIGIDTFLDKISSLNLEIHNACDVHQMTLINVIPSEFGRIEWTTATGTVNIDQVMEKIKNIRGLGKIVWYQKFMFNTIMKLLFTKILNHFEENKSLSETVVTQIQKLYSNVLEDFSNLPKGLANCFSLLMSKNRHVYSEDNDLSNAIHTYLKSVDNINLESRTNEDERITQDSDGIDKIVADLPVRSLEEYISYLNGIAEDLRCFIRLYEFLYSHVITEIGPSLDRFDEMKSLEEELTKNYVQLRLKKLNYEGCQFFHGVQQYCMNAITYMNMIQRENGDEDSENVFFCSETKSFLHTVLGHLKNFNDGYLPNVKTVDRITLAVEFVIQDNTHCNYLKRIIHLIMAELDSHSIEFCNPPDFNFLSSNNINFELNGLLKTKIDDIIQNSTTKAHSFTVFDNRIYSYSRVRNLNNILFSISKTIEFYGKTVTLMWKGQYMDINDICTILTGDLVSPSSIYKLFGVFFKFALAYIYYEIFKYNELFTSTPKKQIITSPERLLNDLPIYFNDIVQDILPLIPCQGISPDVATSINSQFKKMGIHIDFGRLNEETSIVENIEKYYNNAYNRVDLSLFFILMIRDNMESNAIYNHIRFERTEEAGFATRLKKQK